MRGEKLTKRWRLIKLSKLHRSFAVSFIEEAVKDSEMLYSFAVKYGKEKGFEVKRNFSFRELREVAEFLAMLSGVKIVKEGDSIIFSGCPSIEITEVRRDEVCRGFVQGFFSAFGFNVEVKVYCGETCRVEVFLS